VQVAPAVAGAEAQARSAREDGRDASSHWAPRLDLRARYTRLSDVNIPDVAGFPPGAFDTFAPILNNYSLRATVAVPITDYFLRIMPAVDASRAGVEAADARVEAQQAGAALQARATYWGLVRARAAVLITEDAVRQLEAHIQQLEALFEAGEVTRADVLGARAQLAGARAQLAAAQGGVRVTEAALRRQLDLGPNATIQLGEDASSEVPNGPEVDELTRQALASRPELTSIRAAIRASDAGARARGAGRYPSLAVVGNADFANPAPRTIPPDERFALAWDVSVVLSWSPNDYVSSRAQQRSAQANVEELRTQLAQLEDGIAIEAAQAASDMQVARANLESTVDGRAAAEETFRVRRAMLEAGAATPTEVLDAEIARRRAEIAALDALIATHVAEAKLRFVAHMD
jgi:outer membrane protein TolC